MEAFSVSVELKFMKSNSDGQMKISSTDMTYILTTIKYSTLVEYSNLYFIRLFVAEFTHIFLLECFQYLMNLIRVSSNAYF